MVPTHCRLFGTGVGLVRNSCDVCVDTLRARRQHVSFRINTPGALSPGERIPVVTIQLGSCGYVMDPFVQQLARLCRVHVTRCKWVFVPSHAVGRTIRNGVNELGSPRPARLTVAALWGA